MRGAFPSGSSLRGEMITELGGECRSQDISNRGSAVHWLPGRVRPTLRFETPPALRKEERREKRREEEREGERERELKRGGGGRVKQEVNLCRVLQLL